MPTITIFYGIVIQMFWNDHGPPHFHALYGEDEAVIAIGMEGLQEAIRNMPGLPTYGYIGFVGWDETYWTNWPGSENAYTQPYTHWPNFKYTTPFLKPTGG